ncbi:MAG: hypothetical protein LAT63_15395 [Marinobacter sp.]|nr:hypothetical protein [Marinobacter sp.]
MMNKKASFVRKFGGAGLAGALVFGASGVMAADFDVTAQVSNALEVTVVNDMDLGNVFAVKTAPNIHVAITRLTPAGAYVPVTEPSATIPVLLGLGGATAARGSVAVPNDSPFTVLLPPAISGDNLTDTGATGPELPALLAAGLQASIDAGEAIELRIGGAAGNPSVARLYLVNFSLGSVVGGTVTADTAGAATNCTSSTRLTAGDPVECVLTPSFDATAVEFGIGADLVTDSTAARTQYQSGTYSGSFTVTATY